MTVICSLRNSISYGSGESSNFSSGARLERGVGSGMHGLLSVGEPSRMSGHAAVGSDLVPNGRGLGFGSQLPVDARPDREVLPLPVDASNTIFVEGLPPDSTRREVAHIFRPFLGYKEVRLVSKESKHRGGDPLVLCFVDFINHACAATALSALQEPDPNAWKIKADPELIIRIIFAAVFGSVYRTGVQKWERHKNGLVYVTIFKPLGIVFAVVLCVTFLGDIMYIGSVVGSVVIAIGFYGVMWGKTQEEKNMAEENGAL